MLITARRAITPLLMMALSGCVIAIPEGSAASEEQGDESQDEAQDVTGDDASSMKTIQFSESSTELLNPERGFYVGYDLLRPSSAANVRASGHTIALAQVRLDAYRDLPLDAALLSKLDAGFVAARAAGIKVILRFKYNDSFDADASKERILGHIAQVTPLLQDHADVISVMQAGFIGAWGEWHGSTNGLENDADRSEILDAILAALPAHRGVQVRRPTFKAAAYGAAPLTDAEAYSGSARARTGHHNDCFLASSSDFGTFASPVATWQSFVADDGKYTAIGGETCAVYQPRTNCTTAVETMASAHWSYLNRDYNKTVLDGWVAGGCMGEIDERLGYRFVLDQVAHTDAVAPGGVLELQVKVTNVGFASPYNRRPVEVVLDNGTTRHVVELAELDARRWSAGQTTSFTVRLQIPADAAAGNYTLALRLPDESAGLNSDARYAIQLASDGEWNSATGDNVVTRELNVDPAAPGPRDTAATAFAQL